MDRYSRRHVEPTARATARLTALLLVCAAGAACVADGPRHHTDGGGPLGVAGVAGAVGQTVVAYPVDDQDRPSGGPWSFGGIDLCLDSGAGEAVITAVAQRSTIGDPVEHVGSVVRNRYEGQRPLSSFFGFPPTPQTRFRPAAGETITDGCVDASGDHRGQLELIVGLAYAGEGGGGWAGESISYTYAGDEYVLELDRRFIVCGQDPALATACPKYYLQVD